MENPPRVPGVADPWLTAQTKVLIMEFCLEKADKTR